MDWQGKVTPQRRERRAIALALSSPPAAMDVACVRQNWKDHAATILRLRSAPFRTAVFSDGIWRIARISAAQVPWISSEQAILRAALSGDLR